MENVLVASRVIISPLRAETGINSKQSLKENIGYNPIFDNLISEGGLNFFYYIKKMDFTKDTNLMILSSLRHYYYDLNDLKGVNTLINIKMLNHVKHLDSFLCTLLRILPSNANFVGCFKENYINGYDAYFYKPVRFFAGFKNILDSKTDIKLSKKEVCRILDDHGFKVTNMTDINGITYFSSQTTGFKKFE